MSGEMLNRELVQQWRSIIFKKMSFKTDINQH